VHQLAVHTVGGVIGNGETLMLVVPKSDALIIEAKVATQDIDQVGRGAHAVVRIMAGNQRTTPEVNGVLTHVSADQSKDEKTNQIYYTVRVALSEQELRRLGDLKLLPGMPAEVFIKTQERTPLQYLLKPLHEQIARTFRER
jgi:HlyD family secretion protein